MILHTLEQQVQDKSLVVLIKIAGGLVSQDQFWLGQQRPADGDTLLFAICRSLLPQPKLILADEATGNLDPDNKGLILDLLFQSVEDHGATLLAVTHDYELLKRFDRVVDFREFEGGVH